MNPQGTLAVPAAKQLEEVVLAHDHNHEDKDYKKGEALKVSPAVAKWMRDHGVVDKK